MSVRKRAKCPSCGTALNCPACAGRLGGAAAALNPARIDMLRRISRRPRPNRRIGDIKWQAEAERDSNREQPTHGRRYATAEEALAEARQHHRPYVVKLTLVKGQVKWRRRFTVKDLADRREMP